MFTFGERLKQLRKEKNLTQEQLAKIFFLNKSSISRYEKNAQMPENDLLQKIADYFNVSIDYMIGRSDVRDITKSSTYINNIEHEYNPKLSIKDKKDIEKMTENFLKGLEGGAMLNGEILDDSDLELFKQAVKNGLEYAKISNKKKYTPKKYRK